MTTGTRFFDYSYRLIVLDKNTLSNARAKDLTVKVKAKDMMYDAESKTLQKL